MGSYKDKYKNHWLVSNEREKAVKRLLSQFGYELESYGFMAESTAYSSYKPKESGIPDYRIKGTNKYVEVTGTDVPVSPVSPIWVRPDKVQYAKRHPDQTVILVHVLDHFHIYRWIYMLDCEQYPIETKLGDEKFHVIPVYAMKEFKKT